MIRLRLKVNKIEFNYGKVGPRIEEEIKQLFNRSYIYFIREVRSRVPVLHGVAQGTLLPISEKLGDPFFIAATPTKRLLRYMGNYYKRSPETGRKFQQSRIIHNPGKTYSMNLTIWLPYFSTAPGLPNDEAPNPKARGGNWRALSRASKAWTRHIQNELKSYRVRDGIAKILKEAITASREGA